MQNRLLLEIQPSEKDRKSQNRLGILSAAFAILLLCFVLYAGVSGKIGLWAIILLSASVLLFSAIAAVVFHLGKDYLFGIRIYEQGIGIYHPLRTIQERPVFFTPFHEIDLLELEETLELHRAGSRIKRLNVYRVRISKPGRPMELFAEMSGLAPSEILKFRQLPDILLQFQLLPEEKIIREKLPYNQS